MLKINPVEDGFQIEKDSGETIELTPKELIDLIQASHLLRSAAVAELQIAPGLPTAAVTPVTRVSLNQDIHRQEVHLGIADQNGMFVLYAIPLEILNLPIEKLPGYRDLILESVSAPKH
jgi:hypothetical protein